MISSILSGDVSPRVNPDFAPDSGSVVPAFAYHSHPAARGTRNGCDVVGWLCIDRCLIERSRGPVAERAHLHRLGTGRQRLADLRGNGAGIFPHAYYCLFLAAQPARLAGG